VLARGPREPARVPARDAACALRLMARLMDRLVDRLAKRMTGLVGRYIRAQGPFLLDGYDRRYHFC
jgi:hypothetical protein